jgi:hypothetical protein
MAQLPRTPASKSLFPVNRVTFRQKRIGNKIRLSEKIIFLRPFKPQGNNVCFRFPVEDTVILKTLIIQQGKPVAALPAPVFKTAGISAQGKTFPVIRQEAEGSGITAANLP